MRKAAIFINGLPEKPIRGIYFKNMILSGDSGFRAANASDISLDNVKIIPEKDQVFLLNNVKNINIRVYNSHISTSDFTFVCASLLCHLFFIEDSLIINSGSKTLF